MELVSSFAECWVVDFSETPCLCYFLRVALLVTLVSRENLVASYVIS